MMKECAYCGRENDNDAVRCRECGTGEFKSPTAPPPTLKPKDARPEIPPLPPEDLHKDWVTILSPDHQFEASMVIGLLRASGIEARVCTSRIGAWLSVDERPFIQVRPENYAAARNLLNHA